MHRRRTTHAAADPARPDIIAWIMRPDDKLTDEDHLHLKYARAHCPDLNELTKLVHRKPTRPRTRRSPARGMDQPATASSFPRYTASSSACSKTSTLVHCWAYPAVECRAVEGNVNRVKMFKRHMYSRTKLELLRERILARP